MPLIVLEGLDGAGTTTQSERLAKALQARGLSALTTREPTDGPIGTMTRLVMRGRVVLPKSLHNQGGSPLSWDTMALLFAADRLDHVHAELLPALVKGTYVVCDRYVGSSLAYQSVSRQLALQEVADRQGRRIEPNDDDAKVLRWLKEINARAPKADLTLMVNVPASLGKARRALRGSVDDLYEADLLQEGIAAFYTQLHEHLPEHNVCHIDGTGSLDDVSATIWREVSRTFGEQWLAETT
jgi:dTMP kinase